MMEYYKSGFGLCLFVFDHKITVLSKFFVYLSGWCTDQSSLFICQARALIKVLCLSVSLVQCSQFFVYLSGRCTVHSSLFICQAGAVITVLSVVNTEWLYGELNGYRGQFPVEYVDRVPHNLPTFKKDKKPAAEGGSNVQVHLLTVCSSDRSMTDRGPGLIYIHIHTLYVVTTYPILAPSPSWSPILSRLPLFPLDLPPPSLVSVSFVISWLRSPSCHHAALRSDRVQPV